MVQSVVPSFEDQKPVIAFIHLSDVHMKVAVYCICQCSKGFFSGCCFALRLTMIGCLKLESGPSSSEMA